VQPHMFLYEEIVHPHEEIVHPHDVVGQMKKLCGGTCFWTWNRVGRTCFCFVINYNVL